MLAAGFSIGAASGLCYILEFPVSVGSSLVENYVSVDIAMLSPGQSLASDIFDGENLLLRQGHTITDAFIATLHERAITRVNISPEVADELIDNSVLGYAPEGEERRIEHSLGDIIKFEAGVFEKSEIETAVEPAILSEVTECVTDVFTRISEGGKLDITDLKRPLTEMIQQAIRHPNAAVKLLDVAHYDEYTFRHSVNVALLFLALSRDIYPMHRLINLVIGAVLHDIGKTRIPMSILNKPGKLTADEFEIVKSHASMGAEILRQHGGFVKEVIDIAHYHHERWDGTGYPKGLKGVQIEKHVQIAAVCDVYDALTTSRSYKTKMDFYSAMNIIASNSGTHFSQEAVALMVRKIGLYPVGSFVLLSNNQIAVVKQTDEIKIIRPIVCTLFDADGNPVSPPREVDLGKEDELVIVRGVPVQEVVSRR